VDIFSMRSSATSIDDEGSYAERHAEDGTCRHGDTNPCVTLTDGNDARHEDAEARHDDAGGEPGESPWRHQGSAFRPVPLREQLARLPGAKWAG
jgi:hypothetical protein